MKHISNYRFYLKFILHIGKSKEIFLLNSFCKFYDGPVSSTLLTGVPLHSFYLSILNAKHPLWKLLRSGCVFICPCHLKNWFYTSPPKCQLGKAEQTYWLMNSQNKSSFPPARGHDRSPACLEHLHNWFGRESPKMLSSMSF